MSAYFPINCRQQGRLTQFCVYQVLKFSGSILQRKKCSHGRKAKPNAWGRLGAFHWHDVKVHPQPSFQLKAGSWQSLAPRPLCIPVKAAELRPGGQQANVETKAQPLRSTASELQTKPASSEQWGREILSGTGVSCLLQGSHNLEIVLSCHTTLAVPSKNMYLECPRLSDSKKWCAGGREVWALWQMVERR